MMMYRLIDLERTLRFGMKYYWKPNKKGYTNRQEESGVYTKEEAHTLALSDFFKQTLLEPIS